jgi:hypothetical protein
VWRCGGIKSKVGMMDMAGPFWLSAGNELKATVSGWAVVLLGLKKYLDWFSVSQEKVYF